MSTSLDIIGDIHGEKPALFELGRQLGYDASWKHPDGRLPLFLGDLIDRGGHSLEVAELVRHLVATGRAACIMGNHEYNLVAWHLKVPGYENGKTSNKATRADVEKQEQRWKPLLNFFRKLPIAYALPDLRIIHACWHRPSFAAVEAVLAPRKNAAATPIGNAAWLAAYVALESPFDEKGLKSELPKKEDGAEDPPHEVLMKGYEVPCEEFDDVDGEKRTARRATWWKGEEIAAVLTGRAQVMGHYWNLPPVDGQFCPPHSSGHPDLRAWQKKFAGQVKGPGREKLVGEIACVDFNGLTQADEKRACVGALRWPEREVVWATAQKTRPS